MKLVRNINIKADVDKVWLFLTDHEKQKLWMKGLVDIKIQSDKSSLVYIKHGNKVREYRGSLLEIDHFNKIVSSIEDKDSFAKLSYIVSNNKKETYLRCELEINIKGSFIKKLIANPMIYFFGLDSLKKELQVLKSICEVVIK